MCGFDSLGILITNLRMKNTNDPTILRCLPATQPLRHGGSLVVDHDGGGGGVGVVP